MLRALLAVLLLAGPTFAESAPQIAGAHEALLAAQTMLKMWDAEEQINAGRLIACMRGQDRDKLFAGVGAWHRCRRAPLRSRLGS